MPNEKKKPSTPPINPNRFIFGTIADTTWRMFVPIVGLAILGVIIDNVIVTKPFATIAGIIIGVTVAAVLVVRQIRKD